MKQMVVREPMAFDARRRGLVGGAVVAMLGLAACGTKEVRVDEWSAVEMQGEPVKSAGGDGSRRTRIVVLPSEDSPGTPPAARLGARAQAAIEQVLGGGGVEIVDRSLAGKLDGELRVAEMRGSGSYGGPDVADYVVRVKMGAARFESQYVNPSSFTDKQGKVTTIPGGWSNTGRSTMTIEIRSLPALKLVNTIQVEGTASATQQPNQGNNIAAMQSATDRGIQSKRTDVLNVFSPKGYVTERRVRKDESIFRVQLGKNTGSKPGDTVEIYRQDRYGDEAPIGKGEMTNIVGMEGSWMVVKDQKVANQVRHGDYVKVKHGGFMDTLRNLSNSL